MKEIMLSNGKHGEFTQVDDEDFEWANLYSWHKCRGYVSGAHRQGDTRTVYLHREIMGNPDCQIDHIDGNRLNNQRSNLRRCTNQENQRNKKAQKNNTSGYKGVSWHKRDKIYEVNIRVDKKLIYLGRTDCLEDGAKLYDTFAKIYFGEFANLNFPKEGV